MTAILLGPAAFAGEFAAFVVDSSVEWAVSVEALVARRDPKLRLSVGRFDVCGCRVWYSVDLESMTTANAIARLEDLFNDKTGDVARAAWDAVANRMQSAGCGMN